MEPIANCMHAIPIPYRFQYEKCKKKSWELQAYTYTAFVAPLQINCDSRRFQVMATYLAKVANLNLPHLCLLPPMGMISCEFCRDLQSQKTRVPGLSCSVICVILRLAFSVEHRLVTDRQTDRHTTTAKNGQTALATCSLLCLLLSSVSDIKRLRWNGYLSKSGQSKSEQS